MYNPKEGWRGGIEEAEIKWDNQGSKNLERWEVTPLQVHLEVEEKNFSSEKGKQCLKG